MVVYTFFFFQAEDGIRDHCVTGVQTCALPIFSVQADAAFADDLRPLRDFALQVGAEFLRGAGARLEIGRASCRERVSVLVGTASIETECEKYETCKIG